MREPNKERNKKNNLNFLSHAKKCLTYFLKKKKFFLPQVQFGQNNFIETEQKRLKQTIHFFLIIYVVVDLAIVIIQLMLLF
jgi:hypothetical protein